ncbi:lytic transglycosylase domain-containing protein [Colwellia psychrerythraea]|uniref:Lytic murein transglycosylase n=1 Tax=Colwellia psychrerythraea TaxID=28229 RepID=A0A099KZH3_COLPS|nr:lytic murein transglycosylase [Colwellia psychrerythraea]KGJ96109.1 lytic murein transglycosylase [Colwellia psychrerythraea]
MKLFLKVSVLSTLLAISSTKQSTAAQTELTEAGFAEYVLTLKAEALKQGFSQVLIDESFAKVKFHKRAVKADRSQPENVETLDTYLPKRVPKWKVDKARALYKEHQVLLNQIGEKYQVQPRFIVALWGLETNFGKFTGGYNVISALSTLAYEGRREIFFKKQLMAALTILDEGHINIENMKGSWAGAMGQNQFMPTSFLGYAVDGDGDGKKDIWQNQADVFSSMANYLQKEGWSDELTWGRQVKLPKGFDTTLAIPKNTGSRKNWLKAWSDTERTLAQWQALGVRRADGTSLPNVDIKAALVFPDDENGRVYLAYDNYKSLMHWNLSYYFVSSVGHLSDRIKFPPIK